MISTLSRFILLHFDLFNMEDETLDLVLLLYEPSPPSSKNNLTQKNSIPQYLKFVFFKGPKGIQIRLNVFVING